jgi:hypothetical protein
MAQTIWSSAGNPPRSVARRLGKSPADFSDALHKIKHAAGLGGADDVRILDDGTVISSADAEEIGNIYDEI